jgi:mono/diheme cytochrome c family protein
MSYTGGMTKIVTTLKTLLPTLAVVFLISSGSTAQELPDVEDEDTYPMVLQGQDIATMWCDACHIIGHDDLDGGFDGAPPFPSMARPVQANPDYYIAFLTQPHANAMESISLTRSDISALLAYIASLDTEEK